MGSPGGSPRLNQARTLASKQAWSRGSGTLQLGYRDWRQEAMVSRDKLCRGQPAPVLLAVGRCGAHLVSEATRSGNPEASQAVSR